MDVCTKCHDSFDNSGVDISLDTTSVNLMLALEEKSRNHQSH